MRAKGADIPTAWMLILPIVSFYWMWKYAEGVELVTNKEMGAVVAFILVCLLSVIGMVIVQDKFNKVAV